MTIATTVGNAITSLRPLALAVTMIAPLFAQQSGTEVKMQMVLQQPGGKAGAKQEDFSKQAKPGPGKELRVFVEANRECIVSFAGFTQDGQLVYGPPETIHLLANVVKELPASKKWTFDGHELLAEIDAVIADPAAADFKGLRRTCGQDEPGRDFPRSPSGASRSFARMDRRAPAIEDDCPGLHRQGKSGRNGRDDSG